MSRRTPFAASLSSLSGYQKSISIICNALSKINSFCTNTQIGTSFQCQEPDRLKQSSTTFSEDDDFSELGKPVIKNGLSSLNLMTEIPPSLELMTDKFPTSLTKDYDFSELSAPAKRKQMASLKLMTEKPDHFMEFKHSLSSIKDTLLSLKKSPNNAETNPADPPPASRTNENNRNRSHINIKGIFRGVPMNSNSVAVENSNQDRSHTKRMGISGNSNSVAVQNVPTTVGLSTVVEAISEVEKVDSASMHRTSSGFRCEITKNVTIRILGLSRDTTLDTIHSFCKSVGCLEGVAIKQWPAVDAVFRVNADSDLQYVLDKLNGAIIDECHCSAKILRPSDNDHADMPMNQDNRDKMGLQVISHLKELHNQMNLQTLYAEDLYNLHLAIMHLESQSGTSTRDSSLAG